MQLMCKPSFKIASLQAVTKLCCRHLRLEHLKRRTTRLAYMQPMGTEIGKEETKQTCTAHTSTAHFIAALYYNIQTISVNCPLQNVMLDVEADCYWCLCKLIGGIQDQYTYAQPGIQRAVFKIHELVT